MECFCSTVGQHVKNRCNPYADIDQRVRDLTRLQMIKLKYGLMAELSLIRLAFVDVRARGMMFEDRPCTFIFNDSLSEIY